MNISIFWMGLAVTIGLSMADATSQTVSERLDQASTPLPVKDFFRTPNLFSPVLSPDARYVAVSANNPAGRLQLVVLDLQHRELSKVVAGFNDGDVYEYAWVNSERLVFNVRDLQSGDRPIAPGLWGVNKDGTDQRQLIKTQKFFVSEGRSSIVDRRLPWEWGLHSTLNDGTSDVLVDGLVFDSANDVVTTQLARLDTRTGLTQNLTTGAPDHVRKWIVDRAGKPAAVTTLHRGRYASYLHTNDGWKLWEEADALSGDVSRPFWVGPRGEFLVLSRSGSDTAALFELDRTTLKRAEKPVVSTPGYDFHGGVIYDDKAKRVLGVRFETDARGTAWLDADMRTLQSDVDIGRSQVSCR